MLTNLTYLYGFLRISSSKTRSSSLKTTWTPPSAVVSPEVILFPNPDPYKPEQNRLYGGEKRFTRFTHTFFACTVIILNPLCGGDLRTASNEESYEGLKSKK